MHVHIKVAKVHPDDIQGGTLVMCRSLRHFTFLIYQDTSINN